MSHFVAMISPTIRHVHCTFLYEHTWKRRITIGALHMHLNFDPRPEVWLQNFNTYLDIVDSINILFESLQKNNVLQEIIVR